MEKGDSLPPEKVGLLLPAIKKVLFDESHPRKERDYSRKRRSPRPGSPRPDGQGAAILPEELQAELTRLAEATSRVSAWEFHKEAHGIKGDLERQEDEFLSHMMRRNGYPRRQPTFQIQRLPLQRAGVEEIPQSSMRRAGRS